MGEAIFSERKSPVKREQWRELIAEQGQSGMSARQFCKDKGIAEHSFYTWRRRLREQGVVRFALVERGPARPDRAADASLELVMPGGERLRIGAAVDATTLRTVLEALRA